MRICVLSDVHGNAVALQKVIDECSSQSIDRYIFLGDLLIKGPSPGTAYEQMVNLDPICWIRGNTDEAFDLEHEWDTMIKDNVILNYLKYPLSQLNKESINFLLSLNYKESLEIDGIKILCTHGSPRDISENIYPFISEDELDEILEGVTEDLILCGHTHYPMLRTYNGKTIFNPGSISFSDENSKIISYGILEIDNGNYLCSFKVLNYDKDAVVKNAIINDMPNIDNFKKLIDYNK